MPKGLQISIARTDLTLATAATGVTLRSLLREYGEKTQRSVVYAMLVQVDAVCDNRNSKDHLKEMARMVIATNPNLSINSLLMAMRDGLAKGKIFGKLTFPIIAEWINEHRDAVFQYNEEHYHSHK